jgi:tRNA-specific 2-thiouridylase
MPLGEMASKSDTRRLAAELKLPVANKPESQDICFVPFKRYGEFIELYAPEVLQPGPIVDQQGQQVGEHRGVALHTIGQRRGLGLATGQPVFVTELLPESNTVVVGPPEALSSRGCQLDEVNWIEGDPPPEPRRAMARARYRAAEVSCSVVATPEGLEVSFDEPQRAITPGQAVVLYEGEYVLGGGTITRRS